ncbi:alginate O-acetyltransferase AlgX-related protein [Devosia psychrophila]|nr:hypothetical protein [Devosia psychrophila]SFD18155.1 alginate O-acetyltransferase complex protein AlgJ [Devosia psychrophila]
MTNLARWVPIASMLLLMGLGLFLMVQALRDGAFRHTAPTSIAEVTDGEWTHAIEDELERKVLIREPAIHLLNAFEYWLFGEARSGALAGTDGWLFSREEFEWSAQSDGNLEAAFDAITRGVSGLHERGIKVALAFVPAKSDIYQDQLGRYALPETAAELYSRVLQTAAATGADFVPNLSTDLRAVRSQTEVFLHTDTHWSVFGAGRAAASLCALGAPVIENKLTFSTSLQAAIAHRGDLLNFLELGGFSFLMPVQTDLIAPVVAAREIDGADPLASLFGSEPAAIDIGLVGTSYSANPLWSFGDQIKIACQSDLVAYATDGDGPFEPMRSYLETIAKPNAVLPKLVIWEIPVRYLDDYSGQTLSALF